jgi:hypothetical protein
MKTSEKSVMTKKNTQKNLNRMDERRDSGIGLRKMEVPMKKELEMEN